MPSRWRCATGPPRGAGLRRALVLAARVGAGTTSSLRVLVALGADPDALDDQHTPWLVTGVAGSVDMLETLLPASRPGVVNRFGAVSVIPAAERGTSSTCGAS